MKDENDDYNIFLIPIWVVERVATVVFAISTQFGIFVHPHVSIKYSSLLHQILVFQISILLERCLISILLESCLIGFAGFVANVVDGPVLGDQHRHCVVCLIEGTTLDKFIAGVAGDKW